MSRAFRIFSVAAVISGLVAVSLPGGAAAQSERIDGTYVGTIGAEGGFGFEGPGADVYMNILGTTGSFRVNITDDRLIGSWSMAGETLVVGAIGENGALSGGGSFNASGTVVGTMSNAHIVGSNTYENEVTVNISGFSQTSGSSGSEDVSEQLTDIKVVCGLFVARYDQRISQEIEAIDGFTESLNGYISARREGPSELEEDLEQLTADIREWAGNASEASGAADIVSEGLDLMDKVQDLAGEIAESQSCPPDPTFLTELTLAVQDALTTILVHFPGSISYAEVLLGLESGAIGAGSAFPEAAAAIEAAMEADVQQQYEQATGQDPIDTDALVRIAMAARALGMESLSSENGTSFTPQEILILTRGG